MINTTNQYVFNPVDYGFEWTDIGWYKFDRREAHKKAMRERNRMAKVMKDRGHTIRKFSLPKQMITRGGIGSNYPEINVLVTVYGFNID